MKYIYMYIIVNDFFKNRVIQDIIWIAIYSDTQLQNVAPDGGLKSPKHVEHLMKNKDTL